ncbi:tRNA (adenosine(37)-N6)-dimethylallyltransferase MiaA [Candidatus Parcubacteria bacterium]|nr:MAG: tRNA (adenosine(37)-N6)-dimethylallyltransferase MiaA [Candidatus Parcubacteria bacterium]
MSNKVIFILGPTAAGKTKIAVKLAYKFNGEIISVDSRQVYKGMDIGTGKDLDEYKYQGARYKVQIPYHLIDVASPKSQFTAGKYQRMANKAIRDVINRGKMPVICGGSPFYIYSVVDGLVLPPKTSESSRKKLNKLTLKQLLVKLKKLDAKAYNQIDKKNRRRVQRAVEVCLETGKKFSFFGEKKKQDYDFLLLGINWPKEELKKRITERLKERIEKEGMIQEVKRLHKRGVSWKRLDDFGLEYRWVSRYLQRKISYDEMFEKLNNDINNFSKRQMTWFKRDKRIRWVKDLKRAERLVKKFIV